MPEVYLSLGSNIGDRMGYLSQAINYIKKLGKVVTVSPVYSSASWGFEGHDFYNLCLMMQTSHTPTQLMKALLSIEHSLGRSRNTQLGYANRTIDIDILLYGQEIIETSTLCIPHREMNNRVFVLQPLSDIAPQLYHPIFHNTLEQLLENCPNRDSLVQLAIHIPHH